MPVPAALINRERIPGVSIQTMVVSGVCKKGGRKVAYVTFSEGKRVAEGEIPKCRINKSEGFSEKEVAGLEFYMKQNLDMLKKMASAINPIKAMMR